jgi:hypothetical protein
VVTLVRQARRRLLKNELLKQGANASSAALIAFIFLLLLGTQILNWEWAILIPLAAVAVGLYRVRKRLPGLYPVAQLIDRRLGLSDTLSTALFFHDNPPASEVSREVREVQFAAAERLSRTIDPRQAIPYTVPRTIYLMGALALVATSLFALRYGMSRSLDLRQPFARLVQQQFGFQERKEVARNSRLPKPLEPQGQEDDGILQTPDEKSDGKGEDSQNGAEQPAEDLATRGDSKSTEKGAQKQGEEGEKAEGQDGTPDDRSAENGDESQSGQNGSKADSKQDANSKQDGNNSGENSSLLSKMKDAMQNLLSKMKPPQNQPGGQQQAAGEQNSKQGKGQQGGKQQAKDGQQQNGQQGEAQDGQSGEQAENSQDSPGKGQGKNDAQQASKQPGSGVGSQDGDKAIKQAEQLAAMGKISEILGKRSANISGETTVEVQSTSQQIRTQYTQRSSQHTQGGAEISRDEVPVALQGYVEQYFEQIRKQPAVKK